MASLNTTIGILFDVQIVVTLSFGVALVQGWFYFSTYIKKDPWAIQLLVVIVLALETAQMIMVTVAEYRGFVTDAVTTLEALATRRMELLPMDLYQVILTGFLAFFTQHFYSWRIYMLLKTNGNPFALAFAALLSLLSCSANGTWIAYSILGSRKAYFGELQESKLDDLLITTNTLTTVTDLAISGTIIYLLHTSKSESGFRRTTDMINRLIIFTFSTGLPTALAALLTAITAQTNPNTMIYVLFNTISESFLSRVLNMDGT